MNLQNVSRFEKKQDKSQRAVAGLQDRREGARDGLQ